MPKQSSLRDLNISGPTLNREIDIARVSKLSIPAPISKANLGLLHTNPCHPSYQPITDLSWSAGIKDLFCHCAVNVSDTPTVFVSVTCTDPMFVASSLTVKFCVYVKLDPY